jgi:hypothetical protein
MFMGSFPCDLRGYSEMGLIMLCFSPLGGEKGHLMGADCSWAGVPDAVYPVFAKPFE